MSKHAELNRCPCELSTVCKTPFLSYSGSKKPRILVIGAMPYPEDDQLGKLFVSPEGEFFQDFLEGLGVSPQEVGYTNVISCYWNESPKAVHTKSCVTVLTKTLKDTASSVELVLLLGREPVKALLNKVGLDQLHGKVHKIGETYFVPLYSLDRIGKDSKARERTKEDLKKVLALLELDLDTLLDWEMVDADRLEELLPELISAKKLTFDTETSSLDVIDSQQFLVGVGLCWDGYKRKGIFVPLEHRELHISGTEYTKRVALLREVMRSRVLKEAYNALFDLKWVSVGLDMPLHEIRNLDSDPFHAYHFIDENHTYPSLNDLVMLYLPDMVGYDSQVDVWKVKYGKNFELFPLEDIAKYCVGDCVATWRLTTEHFDEMLHRQKMYDVYHDILLPTLSVYAEMYIRGVKLDEEYGNSLDKTLHEKLNNFEIEVQELNACKMWLRERGELLNVSSPKQLSELLYDMLGLPKKTEKRKRDDGSVEYTRTTNEKALDTLGKLQEKQYREGAELCQWIRRYRKLSKLASTYVFARHEWVGEDGLVHTDYNPSGTVSGRSASRNPNLQNLPARGSSGLEDLSEWLEAHPIRKMFVSKFEEGYLVESDYSQLELRLMAALSGDKIMVETYRDGKNGGDIHRARARVMFPNFDNEFPWEQKRLRSIAKTANFAGAYSLDEEFLAVYPGLKLYMEKVTKLALTDGYVSSIFGRRRRLPDLLLSAPTKTYFCKTAEEKTNYWRRHSAIKQACNFGVQGPGKDVLSKAMVKVARALREAGLRAHLVMEVHDSLVVDSPAEERFEVAVILKREMEAITAELDWMTVPLVAEVKMGRNWHEMEEWEIG